MPKPPILLNRFENTQETTHSVIGANGVEINDVLYAAGEFGNGINIPNLTDNEVVQFAWIYTGKMRIDFWYKPNYDWDANTGQPAFIDTRVNSAQFTFVKGDSAQHSFKFVTLAVNSAGVSKFIRWNGPAWTAGDLVHIAWVMDKDGIDGSSDTQRLYYNGVLQTVFAGGSGTQDMALWDTDEAVTLDVGSNIAHDTACRGVMDNPKILDYAKINFDDRHSERGGLNDLAMVA